MNKKDEDKNGSSLRGKWLGKEGRGAKTAYMALEFPSCACRLIPQYLQVRAPSDR